MNMHVNKRELSLSQENGQNLVIDQSNDGIRGKIYDNILQTIGNTPLVKMNRIGEHLKLSANVVAKIEYFNPAGSIKDRPAIAMINALMASDSFTDETEIIDATSGNNGVACAWICAYYGIKLTIVIPEHMSIERRKMIHHYGAKIVTTPKELGTKGAIDHAKLMVAKNPNALMLDQFSNQANPDQHANTTALEIIRDTQGKIDIFVAGVGTGGTLTGVGRALKAYNPNIKVIAVEPSNCPVLSQGHKGTHAIQGLSSGHVPDILDTSLIDEIITVGDNEAMEYARLLARKESLAIGISCGAAMYASAKVARRTENANKNIVTIFADTAERYYSTTLFEYKD